MTCVIASNGALTGPAAAAEQCWPLTIAISPPEGGTVVADPEPNCVSLPGQYVNGTIVNLTAFPATENWLLARWTGDSSGGEILMNGNGSVKANFAALLAGNTTSVNTTIPAGEWRYYYTYVPEGSTSFEVEMLEWISEGGDVDLALAFESPPTVLGTNACDSQSTGTSHEVCQVSAPAAGLWWIGLFSIMQDNVTAMTEIMGCYPLTLTESPPGSAVTVTPENCPGGYEFGTDITLTAANSDDRKFVDWAEDLSGRDNPRLFPMVKASSALARFATRMTPETPEMNVTIPPDGARHFFIDIPGGTGSINVSVNALSGDPDLLVVKGIQNQGFEGCTSQESGNVDETCSVPSPAPGEWRIAIFGDPGTQFDVSVELVPACHSITTSVFPSNAGSVVVSPEPNCGDKWTEGTPVTLTPVANQGFAFAYWTIPPGRGVVNPSSVLSFNLIQDYALQAEFGTEVQSGVPVDGVSLVLGDQRFYYMDVADGIESLKANVNGAFAGVTIFFDSPFAVDYSCYSGSGTVSSSCGISAPIPGRYWARVSNFFFDFANVSFTMTASGGPLCWSITPHITPVGAASGLSHISPSPNCPGDPARYLDGTMVHIIAPPAAAGFRQAFVGVAGGGVSASGEPLELELYLSGDIDLEFAYATRLFSGQQVLGLPLPAGGSQYFFIDIPDGVESPGSPGQRHWQRTAVHATNSAGRHKYRLHGAGLSITELCHRTTAGRFLPAPGVEPRECQPVQHRGHAHPAADLDD